MLFDKIAGIWPFAILVHVALLANVAASETKERPDTCALSKLNCEFAEPHRLSFVSNTTHLLFHLYYRTPERATSARTIFRFDVQTRSVIQHWSDCRRSYVWPIASKDGRLLAFNSKNPRSVGDEHLVVYDTKTNEYSTIKENRSSELLAWAFGADNASLYYAFRARPPMRAMISRRSLASGSVVDVFPPSEMRSGYPYDLIWIGIIRELAVEEQDGELRIVSTMDRPESVLKNLIDDISGKVRKIPNLFALKSSQLLYHFNIERKEIRLDRLYSGYGLDPREIEIGSLAMKHFAFTYYSSPQWEVRLSTQPLRVLARFKHGLGYSAVSADQKYVAVTTLEPSDPRKRVIEILDVTDGTRWQIDLMGRDFRSVAPARCDN